MGPPLTPSAFLAALPALFGATRGKGSLYLTVKRGALHMCVYICMYYVCVCKCVCVRAEGI